MSRKRLASGALRAPTGADIIGTWENLTATARLEGPPCRDENGAVSYDHCGGSDIHWDDQRTITDQGHSIFVDIEGRLWREDQLIHCRAKIRPDALGWDEGSSQSVPVTQPMRPCVPHVMPETFTDDELVLILKASFYAKRVADLFGRKISETDAYTLTLHAASAAARDIFDNETVHEDKAKFAQVAKGWR